MSELFCREATVDDPLGKGRKDITLGIDNRYIEAFQAIYASHDQMQMVAALDGEIMGCMQLSLPPAFRFTARGGDGLKAPALLRNDAVKVWADSMSHGLPSYSKNATADSCNSTPTSPALTPCFSMNRSALKAPTKASNYRSRAL